MSESEEGEFEHDEEESDWEKDKNKKPKIKKKNKRAKRGKKDVPKTAKGTFISSTYRKQKCEFYNKGSCTKGDLCTFSHDFQPDTARKICKFFLSGSCLKHNDCQYSHNTKIYPCKFFHIENRCQMNSNCRFSHQPIPADFYQQYMKDNKDHILKVYKEDRLVNKELIEFIQGDLPKKEVELQPLPKSINLSPQPVRSELNKVWTNTLKKDPRQRIVKPKLEEQSTLQTQLSHLDVLVKKQQQIIEIKVQNLNDKFIAHLKQYFYSYY